MQGCVSLNTFHSLCRVSVLLLVWQDTYLSSEYVYYLIRGYQEGEDAKYYKIVADCKHYAGYDIEDWHGNERYGYNAVISMQDLVETYLPSFKSCLKDAHVGSAMCSYNVPLNPTLIWPSTALLVSAGAHPSFYCSLHCP